MNDYSDEVPPLTKAEKAWMKKLERVLLACPSNRIALQTIGDPGLTLIDQDIVSKYDLDTHDYATESHGVILGNIISKPHIWGVTG